MAYAFQRALVTGATSGIGESFANLLAPDTELLLTGRDTGRLDALKQHLSVHGNCIDTVAADLATAEGRRAVIDAAGEHLPDLVINNAGLGAFGRFTENPPEREAEMVAVNVTAVIELSRALLPAMIARAHETASRCGMIVVSSTASVTPLPFFATYAATKAFERHWGEALAEELRGEPADILVLCPGATRTEFFRRARMAGSMMRHMEEPDAVAAKALDALGRRTVLVSNTALRAALTPGMLPRRLITAGLARFLRSDRWKE